MFMTHMLPPHYEQGNKAQGDYKWLVQNSSLLTGWTEPVLKHSILVLLQCSFVGKLSFFPSSVGKNPVPPSRVCLPRESSLLVTQNTSLLTHLVTKYVEVFPSQQQENVRHQLGVPQFITRVTDNRTLVCSHLIFTRLTASKKQSKVCLIEGWVA